jgi:nucleoside-diphosphate-sugar epimerase
MALPESNGKTVLITGINGYIAGVIGQLLLTKGYSLRGTTRKASSVEGLVKGPYGPYQDRVQIFEVPDMTKPGAFDEAAKGVDGIFHTASPVNFSLTTYEEVIVPAVAGNETLLSAALKAGPQLTSVVVTSSVVAIMNPKESAYVFTEKDFSTFSLEKATKDREEGISTPPNILYGASKTAAERYLWKFRDTHKPSWSLSTINPAVVMGPPAFLTPNPSNLNETLAPLFSVFSGQAVPPPIGSGSFVDVRDVAYAHVWALEHPKEVNGERYITAAGKGTPQAAADILRAHYKGTAIGERISVGEPGNGYIGYDKETGLVKKVEYLPGDSSFDGSKAERVMGFKYRPFEQAVIDTAKAFEAYDTQV